MAASRNLGGPFLCPEYESYSLKSMEGPLTFGSSHVAITRSRALPQPREAGHTKGQLNSRHVIAATCGVPALYDYLK